MSTTPTDIEDRQDMRGLVEGRDECLDRLMERHGLRLFRFLVRLLQDESEAEEVSQEAFVRVYLHRDRFNPSHRFCSWLYSIATNLGRDVLRRRQTRSEYAAAVGSGEVEGPGAAGAGSGVIDPQREAAVRELSSIVRRAVGALPEELRLPVLLSEYEGLSHAEIGEVLGCTAKAVEMRLYRGRQALRQALGPVLSEQEAGAGSVPRR